MVHANIGRYVSKSLHEAEVRYLPLERAILAVVHATHKLPHYFQSHTVVVLIQLLLKSLIRSADYTGRIAKYGTILGAFDIVYASHLGKGSGPSRPSSRVY